MNITEPKPKALQLAELFSALLLEGKLGERRGGQDGMLNQSVINTSGLNDIQQIFPFKEPYDVCADRVRLE